MLAMPTTYANFTGPDFHRKNDMILSFHPVYEADRNLLCAGRDPGKDELSAIKSARAVILPQGCRESLYAMARENCRHVFPNYDQRFTFPDKLGQAHLFSRMNAPHPATETFKTAADFKRTYQSPGAYSKLSYPMVFKFDWGGEGDNVFLVDDINALKIRLSLAESYEKTGQYGFLLQEYIPAHGRSLRIVVIHRKFFSYWRRQEDQNEFYTNLKKGATIDTHNRPQLQKAAIKVTASFCGKTGIDLAGIDLLFSEASLQKGRIEPLLLEINYFFGRKGLGGSEAYYKILQEEIDHWVEGIRQ